MSTTRPSGEAPIAPWVLSSHGKVGSWADSSNRATRLRVCVSEVVMKLLPSGRNVTGPYIEPSALCHSYSNLPSGRNVAPAGNGRVATCLPDTVSHTSVVDAQTSVPARTYLPSGEKVP